MKKLIGCFFIFFTYQSFAQKEIKTFEVSDTVIFSTIDRPGDLYLVLKDGQIHKYDKDGKLKVSYKHQGLPTLFEPRDGARYFAYYRDDQHYEYYNPSFEVISAYKIDPAFAIEPWLICTSGEHKLWVLDSADHSLKKINVQKEQVEIEVLIDSTLIENAEHFTTMREYQGFVFLLSPAKGIHIFNSIGKHIKTIPVTGLHTFNFLGEELYFIKGKKIKFFDLFTADNREVDLEKPAHNVLLSDERRFAIHYKTIKIFEYTP